jgi:deoxyribose-phosphate aldolase
MIGIKMDEAGQAIQDGAEIDMVLNIGKALSQDWKYISEEISQINNFVVTQKAILKVIFENDFLPNDDVKIKLCQICNEYQVAFVKTSTGYGFTRQESDIYSYIGATDHDLVLMRSYCLPSIQVKAAGGIRSLDDLLRVRSLGVTRVGATSTASILDSARQRGYR